MTTAAVFHPRRCLILRPLSLVLALFATTFASHAAPIRLNLNENPYGPSPAAVEAIRSELANLPRYNGDETAALLRAIRAREGVPEDQIVLGEVLEPLGIQLGLRGGPGGEFVYSVPGYTALTEPAKQVGGVVVPVPLNAQLENDLPALSAAVNARTRAVFLVNPHNPSGTVSESAAFKRWVSATAKRTLVIVDEAYLEYSPDFSARTVADLVRGGENVIVFRTFAKIYGLAGLSLGYALAPRELAAQLKAQGLGAPRSLDRLAVAAATASLRDAGYVAGIRSKVAAEREKWLAELKALKVHYAEPAGNFVFFEIGRPQSEFAAALLAKGIDIGRGFPPLDRWARITIGLPEENEKVRAAVREILGSTNK
jgi:histidinol-phosphate aminotransferase